MKRILVTAITSAFILSLATSSVIAQGPPGGDFWADGMLFSTVVTPAELPDRGPKDGLYMFQGLTGQNPVSESKPGDQDYNGGRWQVYVLTFTEDGIAAHDPDGDGMVNFQLQSWEQVQEHIGFGHFTVSMGPSFVCPLIKK